jgi:Zn-dependent protease with chaperone function
LAQAALQLYNIDVLKKTTNELLKLYPEKMATHYYAAIVAAEEENFLLSENEILKAKELGLNEESVNSFLDSGIHTKALMERAKKTFLWILAAWAVGLILLFALGSLLSNYTLKAIEREFKTKSSTKTAHILRNIYGGLINTAGIYYYISLPIILILVVAMVIGLFYLFLMIGRIPIQLMFILVIGACFTIYGMIRSLILKVKYEDPGRELKPSEAPALFELTKEVAKTMGTRPIDEIRITPETDLAVYELGSWREKMRDRGKRVLILGTGVLKDFKQNDFKSILAHEYGHFSHRDTAGGEVALRVRNDIHKYYISLLNAGQAVWWNLAFQFIRLYDFIFRRISNGATRLQEILADRVAAQTYGAYSFENGLTYVIKRNIEFIKLANNEIEEARKVKRPFNNLYDLSGGFSDEIEKEVKTALNRETTNEDTHPSPIDRFRFIRDLGKDKERTDDVYVRDLFKDWNALTSEMTKSIEASWEKA